MNALTNRRTMLRGALVAGAAASVAAVPAMAGPSEIDPVFALLQAHQAAWERLLMIEDATEDHETVEAAGRAVYSALDAIMRIPPTTPAGARAVIAHLVEWDKDGAWETCGQYLTVLLRSSILQSPLLA